MKKQFLIVCLLLLSLCSYAQTLTVKGTVTSASDKEPMIGATVQIKGTGNGSITGLDGDYILTNVSSNAVLVFSSLLPRTPNRLYLCNIRLKHIGENASALFFL